MSLKSGSNLDETCQPVETGVPAVIPDSEPLNFQTTQSSLKHRPPIAHKSYDIENIVPGIICNDNFGKYGTPLQLSLRRDKPEFDCGNPDIWHICLIVKIQFSVVAMRQRYAPISPPDIYIIEHRTFSAGVIPQGDAYYHCKHVYEPFDLDFDVPATDYSDPQTIKVRATGDGNVTYDRNGNTQTQPIMDLRIFDSEYELRNVDPTKLFWWDHWQFSFLMVTEYEFC